MKLLQPTLGGTSGRVSKILSVLLSSATLALAQPAPRSQWVQRVGGPSTTEIGHSTLQLSANRYVSAGMLDTNQPGGMAAYLAFTDASGAALAQRTYPLAGYETTDFTDLVGLDSGRFYGVGYGILDNQSAQPVRPFLSKVDSLGQLLWQREYHDVSLADSVFRLNYTVLATPDGGFTTGYASLPRFWRAQVTRFDAQGRMRWARGLGTYSRAYRMAALPDGSYAVASTDYTRVIQPSYRYGDGKSSSTS